MKKNYSSIYPIVILIILYLNLFINNHSINLQIQKITLIWFTNVFCTLFPLYLMNSLIINYGLIDFFCKLLHPTLNKVFNYSVASTKIFLLCLFSGFPSNAKYSKEFYDNKYINDQELNYIMQGTFFASPLFLYTILQLSFSLKNTILIIVFQYIANFIISFIYRQKTYNSIQIKKELKKPLDKVVYTSIINGLQTLTIILGCMILTALIQSVINIPELYFINGFLEITSGLITLNKYPDIIKIILANILIGFGGFSVHMQIKSILTDTPFNYRLFIKSRIIQIIITTILSIIFFSKF